MGVARVADQAARLRALVDEQEGRAPRVGDERGFRVLAVASGKGGVGKTNLCVNLAATAARRGSRVYLIDGDLGLANADVICGVNTSAHLGHVIEGRCSLEDIAVEGPGGLRLISGASGITRLAHLDTTQRRRIVEGMASLEGKADLVMIDCGAGIGLGVLGFIAESDLALIVATPEPTAIADAYALIKSLVTRARAGLGPASRVALVVNQVKRPSEAAAVHRRIDAVARKFLGEGVELAGWVVTDGAVREAVRARRPFVEHAPRCRAARCVRDLSGYVARALDMRGSGGSAQRGVVGRLREGVRGRFDA